MAPPAAAPPQPQLADVQRLSTAELIARYAKGIENFDRRLFLLSDAQLDTAFLPEAGVGRWPVRVLLGHLADAELAFVQRLRRAVAEESPMVEAWDENAFIDSGMYGGAGIAGDGGAGEPEPIAAYIAVIHTLRRWIAAWLAGLPASAWSRKLLHPERGEQTVRLVLEYATWHLEHHAWFLRAKLDKVVGPRKEVE